MANPPGTIEPGQMGQVGPMNEREPENYYLAEDEKKKKGRGSDGISSDKPGSSTFEHPSVPRVGINPELQEDMTKLDMQKQDAGDAFVHVNRQRDGDTITSEEPNATGMAEPSAAAFVDYKGGFAPTTERLPGNNGPVAPQVADQKNPVWGRNITDRYHGKGHTNPAGLSGDDSALFAGASLEAEAAPKAQNGQVVMKDINPKVTNKIAPGPIGAARNGRGARASVEYPFVRFAATEGDKFPKATVQDSANRTVTTPGEGNDNGSPTSYEPGELKFKQLPNGAMQQVLFTHDGKNDMNRAYITGNEEPTGPDSCMMANIGDIEFGKDSDKDKFL